jgi:predicted Zn finger-like uncharacterized protein
MSLEIECPACHGKFRVPDSAAGKKIRCPKCKGAIEVTAAADAPKPLTSPAKNGEWYLKDEEGNSYGPVSRTALDQWLADGRITADCQLLAVGSGQWQWASDVYPELDDEADDEPQLPSAFAPQIKVAEPQPVWSPAALSLPAEKATEPAVTELPGPIVMRRSSAPTDTAPSSVADGKEGTSRSSRSKAIAGLLGIFLGPLGTHRFYLGYWGVGLAMLFTLGGLGVWSLIDAACVILGRVNDADGRPLSD